MATTVINLYNAQATPDTDIAGENLAYNAKRGRLVIDQETERLIQWGYDSQASKEYVKDINHLSHDEQDFLTTEISTYIGDDEKSKSFFEALKKFKTTDARKNMILLLTYSFLEIL